MSSLYVKVFSGFYTHRKTIRLFSILGESAFWIPPRIWSYAAENQPNGDFSDYSPEEIALLINYAGNAQVMLEALNKAGFLEEMKIHDWQEYNGYHTAFADRAKKAAASRWENHNKKKEAKKNKEDKRGEETSNASSITTSKTRGTIQEIQDFCKSIDLPVSDGESCFHKWEGNGWKNGSAQIKNWQSTIRSWKSAGYMPSQKVNGHSKPSAPKPTYRMV